MWRDFSDWLLSLLHEWVPLLTGGLLLAIAFLYTNISNKELPHKVYWIIIVLTFILASFRSWRKARTEGSDFKDIDIYSLSDIYHRETHVHADLRVKRYIGKRLKLSGIVRSVNSYFLFTYVRLTVDNGDSWKGRNFRVVERRGRRVRVHNAQNWHSRHY
jgi:hypothetical protein